VREQWAEYVPARAAPSYERTQSGVTPLGDAVPPEVEQAMVRREVVVHSDTGDGAGQAALVAPISLRGEVIGALGLHETENKRRWTDDEIALIEAVADQMALAIENARLFEQTQSRAARERLIREITDRIRGAVDVESILQTTVQEVGRALGTSHGLVRLGTEVELGSISSEGSTRE
jgi:GAF domain-containing protein